MITVEEAFEKVEANVAPLGPETVDLANSVGRVLAQDVVSDVDSPPHNKSVMDGFAVRSADIRAGQQTFAVLETIIAGAMPTQTVQPGTCSRIMTGAPMPDGADAVIMVELSNVGFTDATPDQVELVWDGPKEAFASGKHMMSQAQNFSTGQVIFQSGHRIRATDIGLLAEVGAAKIAVYRAPSVAIAPTGDELVDCATVPGDSQIRNSNGPMLSALCRQHGATVTDLGIGADSAAEIESRIVAGLHHDILLLSGGVSAGTMDLVPGLLAKCGVEKVFHKVKVKPGKPIFFGVFKRPAGGSCLIFGLPGNPVSSLIGMHLFVATAIRIMSGHANAKPVSKHATLNAPHQTRGDRPTYWPGRQSRVEPMSGDGCELTARVVEPLTWNGSSDLLSLGTAEGLILFPPRDTPWERGDQVQYLPLN